MATDLSTAALRASSGGVLDQARIGRGALDFLDALILLAVTQANIEPVLHDPRLNREFATYDRPPPDDLRRPITINAVAQTLGTPFETVRRRVVRLSHLGIYRITPQGVVTPSWVVRLASHRATLEAGYRRAQSLYVELQRLGALPSLPATQPWLGPVPLRAVARSGSEYLLRLVSTASAELGDLSDAVIWLEVLRSSHEHLPNEIGIDLENARPVRVSAVAKRVGMPMETVRRRVAILTAQGLFQSTDRGLTLGPETETRPDVARIIADNHRDLGRLFGSLSQLGVLAAWRSDDALAA